MSCGDCSNPRTGSENPANRRRGSGRAGLPRFRDREPSGERGQAGIQRRRRIQARGRSGLRWTRPPGIRVAPPSGDVARQRQPRGTAARGERAAVARWSRIARQPNATADTKGPRATPTEGGAGRAGDGRLLSQQWHRTYPGAACTDRPAPTTVSSMVGLPRTSTARCLPTGSRLHQSHSRCHGPPCGPPATSVRASAPHRCSSPRPRSRR